MNELKLGTHVVIIYPHNTRRGRIGELPRPGHPFYTVYYDEPIKARDDLDIYWKWTHQRLENLQVIG